MPWALVDTASSAQTGSGGGGPLDVTWNHTCSGADRYLIVAVAIGIRVAPDSDHPISDVTFDGTSLGAAIATVHTNNQVGGYIALYGMANPPTGSKAVHVFVSGTITNVDSYICGSVSFTGVDQATPLVTAHTATNYGNGGSPITATISSSTGNLALALFGNGSNILSTTAGTEIYRVNFDDGTGCGNLALIRGDGAASVDLTVTITNDWWATIGVDVKAAAGGGGSTGLMWL